MRLGQEGVCVVSTSTVTSNGVAGRGIANLMHEGRLRPPGEANAPKPTKPEHVRQSKLMSRAAWLAALAMNHVLEEARWFDGRPEMGAYFGVGASGAEMDEVARLVKASMDEGAFSLARCGREGLEAVNPLFAFQIMNNFTLCHGAILEGLAGPNAAFFSRGAGTVTALEEACHAILEGSVSRAIVGGADTALHPVTLAELSREGYLAQGLLPSEGAAALALAGTHASPLGRVVAASVFPVIRARGANVPRAGVLRDVAVLAALDALEERSCDVLVLAPWGTPAREALADLPEMLAATQWADASRVFGEALAATPALAWVLALDMLREMGGGRALVLSAGPDGDIGAVVLTRELTQEASR